MNVFDLAIEKLNRSFYTGKEFNEMILTIIEQNDCELQGLVYICRDSEEPGFLLSYGKDSEGNESSDTINLENSLEVNIKLKLNKKANSNANLMEKCKEIFLSFWNKSYTSAAAGIVVLDKDDMKKKGSLTIERYINLGKNVAVFMMDLDNFKKVNDTYDHTVGTKVIGEFSKVILQHMDGQGILLHQSGDEFNIIMPYDEALEVVKLGRKLASAVQSHKFVKEYKIVLTMAMGIKLVSSLDDADLMDASVQAEEAYFPKQRNASKQRASIRISPNKYGESLEVGNNWKLALCKILSNICNTKVFNNVFLDYISNYVSMCTAEFLEKSLQCEIDDILKWINPDYSRSGKFMCTSTNLNYDTGVNLSYEEIGLAIVHGLYSNPVIIDKDIKLVVDKNLEIYIDKEKIYEASHDSIGIKLSFDGPKIQRIGESSLKLSAKRTVLLQIGAQKCILPEDLFYHVIKIDDRPFKGGGLPDFWAAALSELILITKNASSIKEVLVYGDVQSAPNIVDYLQKIDQWNMDVKNEYDISYISKKTFQSISDINYFKTRISEKDILCSDNVGTITSWLYDKYCAEPICLGQNVLEEECKLGFCLDRRLLYEKIQLDKNDGCNATSLSDAYPLVLEILRNSEDEKNAENIDQTGRNLIELTNFKVVLKSPRLNDLPDYYRGDERDVDKYYDETFGQGKGLFRKKIEDDKQLDKMLEYIVNVIDNAWYSTRRAVLVISNDVKENDMYSPLGLISIWLAPRKKDDRIVIDFTYTWRTVEAIVGLPLSLYASVKFSYELLENIIKQSQKENASSIIKMGKISYIAYSLHMSTDVVCKKIVRGIINDASM